MSFRPAQHLKELGYVLLPAAQHLKELGYVFLPAAQHLKELGYGLANYAFKGMFKEV